VANAIGGAVLWYRMETGSASADERSLIHKMHEL
jgi:hypothetical protein